jgi:hypothetical protein
MNRHGETRNPCTTLVGKPEGTGPLRRYPYRYDDNIKMDLKRNTVWICSPNSLGLG